MYPKGYINRFYHKEPNILKIMEKTPKSSHWKDFFQQGDLSQQPQSVGALIGGPQTPASSIFYL
jgi:hypothetical protein